MKIVTAAGKQKIVMTRKEWEAIGKKAQWRPESRKILVWSGVKSVMAIEDFDPASDDDYLSEMTENVKSHVSSPGYMHEAFGLSKSSRMYLEAEVVPVEGTLSTVQKGIRQWVTNCDFDIKIFIGLMTEETIERLVNEALDSYTGLPN